MDAANCRLRARIDVREPNEVIVTVETREGGTRELLVAFRTKLCYWFVGGARDVAPDLDERSRAWYSMPPPPDLPAGASLGEAALYRVVNHICLMANAAQSSVFNNPIECITEIDESAVSKNFYFCVRLKN